MSTKIINNENIVYKIRDSNGLYSTGGSSPRFNKIGKIWKMKSHLTLHLKRLYHYQYNIYDDCDIIQFIMLEKTDSNIPLKPYIKETLNAK